MEESNNEKELLKKLLSMFYINDNKLYLLYNIKNND